MEYSTGNSGLARIGRTGQPPPAQIRQNSTIEIPIFIHQDPDWQRRDETAVSSRHALPRIAGLPAPNSVYR
jgi:hypothetical protein